jgi:dihydropteroate synthase
VAVKVTKLVGILNITPDSFSDGGDFFDAEKAIARAEQLFLDGADIVDVGAESTRPNAIALTAEQEWTRLEPVLKVIILMYPSKISLDSYHPETVRKALAIGPVIVNDVTGMNNPAMVDVVADFKPIVIVCHLPGQDIQAAHNDELISDINIVIKDLLQKAKMLESMGLQREQIILDPGIGFGKTTELNFGLLKFAELVPEYKVMIGYSRKRFLGEKRMEIAPNLEAGQIAVTAGAAYIRVHDVIAHC